MPAFGEGRPLVIAFLVVFALSARYPLHCWVIVGRHGEYHASLSSARLLFCLAQRNVSAGVRAVILRSEPWDRFSFFSRRRAVPGGSAPEPVPQMSVAHT